MEKLYRIGKSNIEGEGLIATRDLSPGEVVGMSHSNGQPSSEIGQYYNHSESANAVSELVGEDRYVIISTPTKEGEEIVLDYRQQPELQQPEDFEDELPKAQDGLTYTDSLNVHNTQKGLNTLSDSYNQFVSNNSRTWDSEEFGKQRSWKGDDIGWHSYKFGFNDEMFEAYKKFNKEFPLLKNPYTLSDGNPDFYGTDQDVVDGNQTPWGTNRYDLSIMKPKGTREFKAEKKPLRKKITPTSLPMKNVEFLPANPESGLIEALPFELRNQAYFTTERVGIGNHTYPKGDDGLVLIMLKDPAGRVIFKGSQTEYLEKYGDALQRGTNEYGQDNLKRRLYPNLKNGGALPKAQLGKFLKWGFNKPIAKSTLIKPGRSYASVTPKMSALRNEHNFNVKGQAGFRAFVPDTDYGTIFGGMDSRVGTFIERGQYGINEPIQLMDGNTRFWMGEEQGKDWDSWYRGFQDNNKSLYPEIDEQNLILDNGTWRAKTILESENSVLTEVWDETLQKFVPQGEKSRGFADPTSLYRAVSAPNIETAERFGTTIPSLNSGADGRRTGYTHMQRNTPYDVLFTTPNESWIGGSGINDQYNLFNLYGKGNVQVQAPIKGYKPYVVKMPRTSGGVESLKTINNRTDILNNSQYPYSENSGSVWNKETGQFDVPTHLGSGIYNTVSGNPDLSLIPEGSLVNPNYSSFNGNQITPIFGPKGTKVRNAEDVLPIEEYFKKLKEDPNWKFNEGGSLPKAQGGKIIKNLVKGVTKQADDVAIEGTKLYRGIGPAGYKDLITSGFLRPKQNVQSIFPMGGNSKIDISKSFENKNHTYFSPKFEIAAGGYSHGYVAEVDNTVANFLNKKGLNKNTWSQYTTDAIPIESLKIFKLNAGQDKTLFKNYEEIKNLKIRQEGGSLTPQINTLIERISTSAFKDQVYAQHKNIHGEEPSWNWDDVLAKQIKLIQEGSPDGTYDPTVMQPLTSEEEAISDPNMVAGMLSAGDNTEIGSIKYNPEHIKNDDVDLVKLHEVTHRMNAMEETELTPYLNTIYSESGNSRKNISNGVGDLERDYLKNMMGYGVSYFPESGGDGEAYYPRSKNDYNWLGSPVGETSKRESYMLKPSEGHGYKTVVQEELKGLGIHDFNSGAFDDAALEKLYNMTAKQFESLTDSTQEYLGGLGLEEIIFPEGKYGSSKWLDNSSVEDKKNDTERKDNIFRYMNDFWGDATDETGSDNLQPGILAKYGGSLPKAQDGLMNILNPVGAAVGYGLDFVKNQIADNIHPLSYSGDETLTHGGAFNRVYNAIMGNGNYKELAGDETEVSPRITERKDLLHMLMGLEQENNSIPQQTQYNPSEGHNEGDTYYSSPVTEQQILEKINEIGVTKKDIFYKDHSEGGKYANSTYSKDLEKAWQSKVDDMIDEELFDTFYINDLIPKTYKGKKVSQDYQKKYVKEGEVYWKDLPMYKEQMKNKEGYNAWVKEQTESYNTVNVTSLDDFLTGGKDSEQIYSKTLGNFKVDKGEDEKGTYLSYYDKWDLAPYEGDGDWKEKVSDFAQEHILGVTPPSIYNRMYYTQDKDGTYKFKNGGSLPRAQDGNEGTSEFSMNAPLYDTHGRCFVNCQQRSFDSLHNFYTGLGTSMGKSGDNYTGTGKVNVGYELHPRGGTGNITGHVGANYGTRLITSDGNDGSFTPFSNATASVGYEGEMGGNSYNWQNEIKWGLGAHVKKDIMGDNGYTVGAHGNIGQFNVSADYNPNTGVGATVGIGIPFRQRGGGLSKTIKNIISKPKKKYDLYKYSKAVDAFGNSGATFSNHITQPTLRGNSIINYRGLSNTNPYTSDVEGMMQEYTIDSTPFKFGSNLNEGSGWPMSTMRDINGNVINAVDDSYATALQDNILNNKLKWKSGDTDKPLTLVRQWNENSSIAGSHGDVNDLLSKFKSGETFQLGDITSWSTGQSGLQQFGNNRYIIKDFDLNTPALLNEYKGLTKNQAKVWKEREVLLANPKFKVSNVIKKAPRTPHFELSTKLGDESGIELLKGLKNGDGLTMGHDISMPVNLAGSKNRQYKDYLKIKEMDPDFKMTPVPQYGTDIELELIKKMGGTIKKNSKYTTSPFNKEKLVLNDTTNIIKEIASLGGFTSKFKKGGECKLKNGYTASKQYDEERKLPFFTYGGEPNIEGKVYYDQDSQDDPYEFNVINIMDELIKKQNKHNRTKMIIEKYETNIKLSSTEFEHLNSLGLLD